jgi:hypothetical protein
VLILILFVVGQVDVGLDAKAITEACNAIQKKHEGMAVMLLSADSEKEKAVAYAVTTRLLFRLFCVPSGCMGASDCLCVGRLYDPDSSVYPGQALHTTT